MSADDESRSIWHELIGIKTQFPFPPENAMGFEHYLKFIEHSIDRLIPPFIKGFGNTIQSLDETEKVEQFFKMINQRLPLFHNVSQTTTSPYSIAISTMCPAHFTHGVGRFMSEFCSQWLIPGKQLPLACVYSVAIEFKASPGKGYFIHELIANVESKAEIDAVEKGLPNMLHELRLNILAVQHARSIISLKSLSFYEKKLIIQENIASLLDKSSREFNQNIFDQMHNFLFKVSAEDKVSKVKEQISPILDLKPQIFERDIFNELQQFIALFPDEFSALRDITQLTRIICYLYLFRKMCNFSHLSNPYKRHLLIKVIKTKIHLEETPKYCVSIIVGMNFLGDDEIFEESHLVGAIQSIVPDMEKVNHSYIAHRKEQERVRVIYIEVEKKDSVPITSEEIKRLKSDLSREIQSRIQRATNTIFMPRNEEEVIRNVFTLSEQLKYVNDIPQLMIHYHKQDDTTLTFTVSLLRILKKNTPTTKKLLAEKAPELDANNLEVKVVGFLRKKYPKEANVFEVKLEKKPFLRKDFSVDLYAARHYLFDSLSKIYGEIRDYNGGMISKQSENLEGLKKILATDGIENDFLLQNYFYSLTPIQMQSILPPAILAHHFKLAIGVLNRDYSVSPPYLASKFEKSYGLYVIGGVNDQIKNSFNIDMEQFPEIGNFMTQSSFSAFEVEVLAIVIHCQESDWFQLVKERIQRVLNQNSKVYTSDIFSLTRT
ncbi:MAG: hypothetical protein S4CHLAM102_03720 [Chlamydiia bacterium]|nr:hypothetical protein [Chlamydiia bacterium]